MKKVFESKALGLLILLLTYILASTLGIVMFYLLNKTNMHYMLNVLLCDIAATVFVWLMGVIFKTASMYDPYWSVQSVVIYVALLFHFNNWNVGSILFLVLLSLWAIRLTVNFILGFDNLSYVDWRYRMLKEKSGKLYQLVNLFGICLFPTFVVYMASLPLFIYATSYSFNPLQLIGLGIMLIGTLLELFSDIEMKKFIKIRTSRSEVINIGLWNYSRHPNYLGEISFWFGVYFVLLLSNVNTWPYVVGAALNLLMFLIISIPMEEKHMMEYKPSYQIYKKETSMLLLLPKRKIKEETIEVQE